MSTQYTYKGSGGVDPARFVEPRRYDPILAARARRDFAMRAREVGTGTTNAIMKGLKLRGLGRSGGLMQAFGAGNRAKLATLQGLNLPYAQAEQDFTEGARRFDIGAYLRNKEMAMNYDIARRGTPSFSLGTPWGGISF